MGPRTMDKKRLLSQSAQCLSLWYTAHRGSSSFESHWMETRSEIMLSMDPREAGVGLQDHRFGRYAASDR